MKLFGWKAAREAARPVLAWAGYAGAISRIGLGVIGGAQAQGASPQGYEAQLREGYLANAVAQRAVRVVADAVAGAIAAMPRVGTDYAIGSLRLRQCAIARAKSACANAPSRGRRAASGSRQWISGCARWRANRRGSCGRDTVRPGYSVGISLLSK